MLRKKPEIPTDITYISFIQVLDDDHMIGRGIVAPNGADLSHFLMGKYFTELRIHETQEQMEAQIADYMDQCDADPAWIPGPLIMIARSLEF